MAVPIHFPSTTPNAALPLLFSGQAQKEFFLNQAFSILDALLPRAVEQHTSTPPDNPAEGACFLVGPDPIDGWAGHIDEIAMWIAGAWQYVSPQDGMQVFNRETMATLLFEAGWSAASEPAIPTGGATVDSEARAAIGELIEALRMIGVFPRNSA
ncbi:hypothetical protein NAP1_12173 [Erythrobacter sp. NAP1]|uniref:DUF2793 domain-containing protein n=1 Tax=Erythrobacter sp. NAP1 TaxID=237727 RepID=UPI00006878DA|nr:DUF2793 domain-containing protein [Erythrobacter sp. NAP1]EAQ28352.1 hypothetical protein NAP1_12173 [Erythrobacter sp. NAP1]